MKNRISWIEDDADIIYSVVAPLENSGFVIDVYRTGQEALENIDQIRASSLLLLDLIFPSGKDEGEENRDEYQGILLLQTLRIKYAINIPVIVLSTASAVERFTKTAHDLLVSDILVKPCRPSQLKRSVIATLNSPSRSERQSL